MPAGTRVVAVIDRGWVFAGNIENHEDGSVTLTDAVWIFCWTGEIGFNKMIEDPTSEHVDVRPMPAGADVIELPKGSVLFTVPVNDDWGKL